MILILAVSSSLCLNSCNQALSTPPPAFSTELNPAQAAPKSATSSLTSSTTPPPPDPWATIDPSEQNIILWHSQLYDRAEALLEILSEFNATNPWGIRVDAIAQDGQNELFYATRNALNTAAAPDLVYLYQNQAASLQRYDGLIDLNSLLSSPHWGISQTDLADLAPALLAQDIFPSLNGLRLGFPTYRSAEVLYYNQDWLNELGYSNPPQTPQEFKEIACQASQRPFSQARDSAGSLGYALNIDASRFATWTFAFGGDLFTSQGNIYTFDSPPAIQSMQFLQDLLASGCAEIVDQRYVDQDDFARGTLLFTIGTSSGIPFYTKAVDNAARFQWDVAAPPHVTGEPRVNFYGPSLSILHSTPEKELAAWLVIQHLASLEAQVRWASVSQYLPVHAQADERLQELFTDFPAYRSAYQLLPYAHFEPSVPGYEDVRLLVNDAMIDILQGAEVDTTLTALNNQANTILADQSVLP